MAQRTLHYALGQLLAARFGLEDAPRFLFGTLLPDAVAKAERDASHYAYVSPERKRCYDFDRFRRDFAAFLPGDPLFLGYYIHLVEDNFYRDFCHRVYDLYFISPAELQGLYRDYHLLNPWLKKRYGLENRVSLPADWAQHPVRRVAPFDAPALLRDFAADLSEQPEGSFTTLSPAMMDRFVAETLPQLEREMEALLRGERYLRPMDFAWDQRQK